MVPGCEPLEYFDIELDLDLIFEALHYHQLLYLILTVESYVSVFFINIV